MLLPHSKKVVNLHHTPAISVLSLHVLLLLSLNCPWIWCMCSDGMVERMIPTFVLCVFWERLQQTPATLAMFTWTPFPHSNWIHLERVFWVECLHVIYSDLVFTGASLHVSLCFCSSLLLVLLHRYLSLSYGWQAKPRLLHNCFAHSPSLSLSNHWVAIPRSAKNWRKT